ncbi:MAG: inositol monophosphatase family protein [Pseudomonadota bacterium]|nr:inositol monophosphatase family protein [Pseudomonadota bacterium]
MNAELETLCRLLRDAAEAEIMPRFQRVASRSKADGSLVTEADLAVQRRIIEELQQLFPETPVLGEEMSRAEQQRLLDDADRGVWCLDPLDGTSNYACGFPFFSVSLALLKGGEPVTGVILDPVRDECFCAERGGGAFLDGQPLRLVSERTELADCLAMVDLKRLPEWDLSRLGGESPYRSQRNLGSVALDWCWLAAGRIQLYLHGGQKLWDYAAGRVIATEAGVISRLFARGGLELPPGLSLEPRMAVAASNSRLFERWTEWLQLPRKAA